MADAALIAQYNVALAKESENLTLEPAVVRKGVLAVLSDPAKGIYFVVDDGPQMVGQLLVTYEWSDWRNGNFWWLQSVYVHPEFRSRGVFQSLFDHVLEQAKNAPQTCGFRLYVEAHNNRAKAVYDRLSFKDTEYQLLERLFVC